MGNKSNALTVNVVTLGLIVLVVLFFLWPRGGGDILPPEPTPTPTPLPSGNNQFGFSFSLSELTLYRGIALAEQWFSVSETNGNFSANYLRIQIQDNDKALGMVLSDNWYEMQFKYTLYDSMLILNQFQDFWLLNGARQITFDAVWNVSETAHAGYYDLTAIVLFHPSDMAEFAVLYPTAIPISTVWGRLPPMDFYKVEFPIRLTVI